MTVTHTPDGVTEAERKAEMAQARLEVSKRRYYQYIALVVTLTLVAVVISGYIQRNQLLDCVQEGGHCYEQGQQRTAEVVGDLLEGFQKIVVKENNQLLRDMAELLLKPNGDKQS